MNVAARELGAGSSCPMAFPFTTGADYYRADDEKDEYEVDNSFDYTPEEETSDLQQPNKLMTTTSQTTATVIEQQTSLTLPPSFEEEQRTSDNEQGTTETSGEEEEEKGGSLDEGDDDEDKQLKSPAPVAAKMTDDVVPVHLNLSTVAPLPLRDDPAHAVKNVFPHVNVDDGEGIVSETSSSENEEAAEQTEKAAQVASSTPLMPAAATITSSPKPIQVNTPVTPKKPKRAASKKRKTPPTRGKPGGNRSVKERRSSRTQHEPRSTCAVSFAAEMSHFNLLPCYISCDHCGKKIKDSLGNATRHLKSCPVLRNQQLVAAQKEEEAVQNDVELPIPAATPVNSGMTLVQLMGTEALAAKVPGAFASTPFAGDAPLDRFDSVVKNDVTGLRHLVVVDLLEAVNVSDGPILQLQTTVPSGERRTGHDQLTPLSKAKARALEGKSLRFPAPHTVAEQFITPLAQELGLEYAMQQHRVNIVSCPQDDVGLDWRFRQTETVVFQLRGEATWKLKRGKVDYPLCDFEPQTWLMEEMAQLAKVHGLAAGTGTKGFLLSPREELSVFNVDGSGENEVLEHVLRAGSVAYVPAGVWFYSTTHGKNTLWLEVELSSMTYETLALSALKHLACGDKQTRKRLQIHRGNRDQIKATRCHLQTQILSLRSKMIELEGADLLPEYLCTDDLQELISRGLIRVLSKSPGSPLSIEVDLTNPKFKLKHEKVYKDARYRVNPIALLLREDEIPHRSVNDGSRDGLWSSLTEEKHLALKKRPKPPPKCTKAPRQRYNFDLPVGSQDCKLLLHVCCQCSLEQSKFVEWIRSRGEKSFGLEELARRGDLLLPSKSSGRTEETARNVLRFLHFVGYVTLGRFP